MVYLMAQKEIVVSFRHLPRDWSAPLLAARCALVVVAGLVVGLHVFGESWDLSWHAGAYRPDVDVYLPTSCSSAV